MTEVPEHLLARAKAARAKAAGGGGGDEGAPPATPGEAPGTGAAATAVEPAAAAAAPAPVVEPPKPVPHYVAAAVARPKVPRFAIPVLAALPVWALIYAGTLTGGAGPADPELAMGAEVYASACSGCHGAGGQGGTGRPLGEVVATFPDRADHIAWVENGSPEAGSPYGDPAQGRVSQQGWPAMPGFASTLSPEEIAAVVRYEREEFGGEEATPAGGEAAEGGTASDAEGETEPSAGEGEDTGSSTNEADAQGGDTSGTDSEGPGAGVDGGEGSGSDASPSGG